MITIQATPVIGMRLLSRAHVHMHASLWTVRDVRLRLQGNLARSEVEGEALVQAHKCYHCLSIRQLHSHARPATLAERGPRGAGGGSGLKHAVRAERVRLLPPLRVPLVVLLRHIEPGALGYAVTAKGGVLPAHPDGAQPQRGLQPQSFVEARHQEWELIKVIVAWHCGSAEGIHLLQKACLRSRGGRHVIQRESNGAGGGFGARHHDGEHLSCYFLISKFATADDTILILQ
mmetsp:Transcript_2226/g.6620  ORF Transcript_2226/g.6620 Transcript_2226/m.6620 type:complete len:232 (-) Transcript_2226:1617-2312(-)